MNINLLTFDTLDSTNTEALKQARLGADEGVCIVARQQTAGRGRHGRAWVSEPDAGLYLSIVLRPKIETQYLPLITLMTGVAVHNTLAEFGVSADIKWVNDLHVDGKKISGILAETTDTPQRPRRNSRHRHQPHRRKRECERACRSGGNVDRRIAEARE